MKTKSESMKREGNFLIILRMFFCYKKCQQNLYCKTTRLTCFKFFSFNSRNWYNIFVGQKQRKKPKPWATTQLLTAGAPEFMIHGKKTFSNTIIKIFTYIFTFVIFELVFFRDDCKDQVHQYSGAQYKKFSSYEDAQAFANRYNLIKK